MNIWNYISLYQIVTLFNELIYTKFNINIKNFQS